MSKYIYTTIYEQFTGLKPPEPKNNKPRRRRGYGHPYRMRLNMQEEGQAEEMMDNLDIPEDIDQQPQSLLIPASNRAAHTTLPVRKPSRGRHPAQPQNYTPVHSPVNPVMTEVTTKTSTAPKVTYKKRRQYNEPTIINPLLSE